MSDIGSSTIYSRLIKLLWRG